ncbi:MAG: chorismate mutase [Pseudomonadota bacterium]
MADDLSTTRQHTSDTAETMADVRREIDRIDQILVGLLAERQSFMDAAARIKASRDVVHDRARIEDVISKVLKEAATAGLSPAIAEPVWRVLIDRCIAYEFRSYDALKRPDTDN